MTRMGEARAVAALQLEDDRGYFKAEAAEFSDGTCVVRFEMPPTTMIFESRKQMLTTLGLSCKEMA